MKTNRPSALAVWKQLEEHVVPRLRLSVADRAVYAYLLSHSRLEGRPRFHFSICGLARHIRLTGGPIRASVRRLVEFGALRLIDRSKTGHIVEVRLPAEIRAARTPAIVALSPGSPASPANAANLEQADFLRSRKLRQAIHARERGLCFYCLRRISSRVHCIDHVVPRASQGRNSYRNLVSACLECNATKGQRRAEDFLRSLYRDGRLTASELHGRLRALRSLASGKLLPVI